MIITIIKIFQILLIYFFIRIIVSLFFKKRTPGKKRENIKRFHTEKGEIEEAEFEEIK